MYNVDLINESIINVLKRILQFRSPIEYFIEDGGGGGGGGGPQELVF
jgi:hypothetical protein